MGFITHGVATNLLIRVIVALDRSPWMLLTSLPLPFAAAGQEDAQQGGKYGDTGKTTRNALHTKHLRFAHTNAGVGAAGGPRIGGFEKDEAW